MNFYTDLFDYVEFVMPEFEGKILPANLDMESSDKPYLTVRIISQAPIGQDEKQYTEDAETLEESVHQRKQSQVEVNFYTAPLDQDNLEDSRHFTDLFTNRLRTSINADKAQELGLYIWDTTDYSNLDEWLGDKYESRSSMEMRVGFISTVTSTVDKVAEVTTTGTYIDIKGDPI